MAKFTVVCEGTWPLVLSPLSVEKVNQLFEANQANGMRFFEAANIVAEQSFLRNSVGEIIIRTGTFYTSLFMAARVMGLTEIRNGLRKKEVIKGHFDLSGFGRIKDEIALLAGHQFRVRDRPLDVPPGRELYPHVLPWSIRVKCEFSTSQIDPESARKLFEFTGANFGIGIRRVGGYGRFSVKEFTPRAIER